MCFFPLRLTDNQAAQCEDFNALAGLISLFSSRRWGTTGFEALAGDKTSVRPNWRRRWWWWALTISRVDVLHSAALNWQMTSPQAAMFPPSAPASQWLSLCPLTTPTYLFIQLAFSFLPPAWPLTRTVTTQTFSDVLSSPFSGWLRNSKAASQTFIRSFWKRYVQNVRNCFCSTRWFFILIE